MSAEEIRSDMMKIELLHPWGRHEPGEKTFFRPIGRMLIGQGLAREIVSKPKRGK